MNKNNTWKYLSLVIFAVVIITSILWIRGDFDVSKIVTVDKDNELVSDIKPDQNLNTVNNIKPSIQLKTLDEDFDPPAYIGGRLNGVCGKNLNDLEEKITKAKKNRNKTRENKYDEEFSDIQLLALEGVKSNCSQWYDFLGSLSDKDLSNYENQMKESKELNKFFSNGNEISDEDKRSTARSMVSSGEIDDTSFSSGALRYLLTNDYYFIKRIAYELNIKGIEYIQQNVNNIVFVYNCSINFESECAPNSLIMLNTCYMYANEDSCGVSLNQYIAARTTPNNYADLENIVSIIKKLIHDGYFDQYLE